ncbi:MAG: hypothetical protein KDD70_02870 [Bdellovibrionales bacterium]|nr:hypothetical protein [Bdellovibrionales bacterium]
MTNFQPYRVTVKELNSSRYPDGERPSNWDFRVAGLDYISTTDGSELALFSDGQQSPPKPGWTILITGEVDPRQVEVSNAISSGAKFYSWTLYGMSPQMGASAGAQSARAGVSH